MKNKHLSPESPMDWMFCFMYDVCKISSTDAELAKKFQNTKITKKMKLSIYIVFSLKFRMYVIASLCCSGHMINDMEQNKW